MKEKKNSDLLAEQICMEKCLNAVIELKEYYLAKSSLEDSVVQEQANAGMVRCLQWLVNFIIPKTFIARHPKE